MPAPAGAGHPGQQHPGGAPENRPAAGAGPARPAPDNTRAAPDNTRAAPDDTRAAPDNSSAENVRVLPE
jgi:hypothetical protein